MLWKNCVQDIDQQKVGNVIDMMQINFHCKHMPKIVASNLENWSRITRRQEEGVCCREHIPYVLH